MKLDVGRWRPRPRRPRPAQPPPDRPQVGRGAEARARAWLEACGHTILDQNWRRAEGELDLVACDEVGRLIFVEVRALRGALVAPEQTVTFAKRAQVVRVARRWLMEHPRWAQVEARFDVIGVRWPEGGITHLSGAFDADGGVG